MPTSAALVAIKILKACLSPYFKLSFSMALNLYLILPSDLTFPNPMSLTIANKCAILAYLSNLIFKSSPDI